MPNDELRDILIFIALMTLAAAFIIACADLAGDQRVWNVLLP